MNQDGAKLIWRCRRGIREMDLLLQEFIKNRYDTLSIEEKTAFESLLNETDLDILEWITGRKEPASYQLQHVVTLLQETSKRHNEPN